MTEKERAFKVENVPAGRYTLNIWHEKLADEWVEVVVEAGKTATVDVEPKRKKK